MARGVVQVAGDAGAFLRGGEAAFALGFALGAQRALLQLGHAFVPQPCAVADEPRAAPDDDAERHRCGEQVAALEPDRGDVRGQQARRRARA